MTGHFEAKKHAYRQTQDGIVVSFVIHPNDVDAVFAVAPLGTRYMLGFAEIGDDGRPVVTLAPQTAGGHARAAALTPEVRSEIATKAATTRWDANKERKSFASLPLSQQAAMRTNDPDFRRFLAQKDGPSDFLMLDSEMGADEIRHCCGVTSRADIKNGQPSGAKWLQLEAEYQAWITTNRYASVAR